MSTNYHHHLFQIFVFSLQPWFSQFSHHAMSLSSMFFYVIEYQFFNQIIMNKGALTAITQHYLCSCHTLANPMLNLHWNNAHADQLRSCISCHASTLQIIVETNFFFFRFSPLSTDSHLSWISWLVYIHVEELDDSLYNKSRPITEYVPLHCDAQSLVLNIHSQIFAFLDLSFKVFLHKYITTFQFVSFITANTCIWILLISNYKCWNVLFRVAWFPLPYCCTAIFENTGSVTIRVSSLTTWMASAISGPLVLLFGMANTF